MSTHVHSAALRRAELMARMDEDRESVADAFTSLQGRMKVAETLVGVVRGANRHRVLTGTIAVLAIVAPFAARTWLKRAAWFLPLAIEGIRLGAQRARRPSRRRRLTRDYPPPNDFSTPATIFDTAVSTCLKSDPASFASRSPRACPRVPTC